MRFPFELFSLHERLENILAERMKTEKIFLGYFREVSMTLVGLVVKRETAE